MAENSTIIEPAFNYVILMRNEIGHNLLFYMTALMSFISKQCLSGGVHQDSVLKIFLFISYISAMLTPRRLVE
jgi:hypothetical protein